MKLIWFIALAGIMACSAPAKKVQQETALAQEVKKETQRTWQAYQQYAWGYDVLLPISKSAENWYDTPLYISPIDAFSTLKVMGLDEEASRIERYVADSISFDKDIYVKVFEVNIRVLGGLLSMYQYTGNGKILAQAKDFGDRLLPAFGSATGMPYYWVNLKTGAVKGNTINVAEAGTYTFEMGILSYYTQNPVYYQAAKKATKAVFDRRSKIGLVAEVINVETGDWIDSTSHICACIDSYYEYLYKTWVMFGDPEIKAIWDESILAVNKYLPEEKDSLLWYGRVNMNTGEKTSSVVTLYDAFFPAVLSLSGNMDRAERFQYTWDWLWNKYGLEPMAYDYSIDKITYPVYDLNPEIIESAFYLYHFTGNETYRKMATKYWEDIKRYCRTDVAFTAIEDVETKEKRDYMATYFLAETLKYFYLVFSDQPEVNPTDYVFSTEAHNFKKAAFEKEKIKIYLGL
jgi:mannosidase alpha-like ER degradation enhancer 1/mannosidase alpha-like ER degradation enhancer 2